MSLGIHLGQIQPHHQFSDKLFCLDVYRGLDGVRIATRNLDVHSNIGHGSYPLVSENPISEST
jgi:hypothetical protein